MKKLLLSTVAAFSASIASAEAVIDVVFERADTNYFVDIINLTKSDAEKRFSFQDETLKSNTLGAIVDIDGDGMGEVFIKSTASSLCDYGVCPIKGFKVNNEGNAWVTILDEKGLGMSVDYSTTPASISIRETTTKSIKKTYNGNRFVASREDFTRLALFKPFTMLSEEEQLKWKAILGNNFGDRYEMVKHENPSLDSIKFAEIDINNDTHKETIVSFTSSAYCDSEKHCLSYIYQANNPSYAFGFYGKVGKVSAKDDEIGSISSLLTVSNHGAALLEFRDGEGYVIVD